MAISPTQEVVFFDIDGTLVDGNLQLSFLAFLHKKGVMSFAQRARTVFHYVLHLAGFHTHHRAAFEAALSGLRGRSPEYLQELVADFLQSENIPIYAGAMEIIKEHRENGRRVVLLTTIVETLAQAVAEREGAVAALGTHLEMRDGLYTGHLSGQPVYGQEKVEAAEAYLHAHNLTWANTWAYGDSASDLLLLEKVAHGFVVNPSHKMQSRLQQTHCKVVQFT
ncbi:MAG TPA: HAD-IB family hydrolase [Candidatus Paceibacterota bacterium]